MRIAILYNSDHDVLADDPGREAREDVVQVAQALHDALAANGLSPQLFPIGPQPFSDLATLQSLAPDLAVNLCESLAADSRGEMAVPCLLDVAGIPHTGSPSLALGLALHKDKAKELLQARGIPTPEFRLVEDADALVDLALPFPLIVKPVREDASAGITQESVVHDRPSLARAVAEVLRLFRQPALVERFIPGREVYVPLLGNRPRRALPLSEIRFGAWFQGRPHVVSYRAKWELESPECLDSPSVPCELDRLTEARVVKTAMSSFDALGCRDYGRVDVRIGDDGEPYVIDVNPNCDLHPGAGFARSAAAAGMNYTDLALRLVELALERSHGYPTHRAPRRGAPRRAAGANRDLLPAGGRLRG